MKNLLIISHSQYGSLIDTYKYCQYLDDYYITYLSFDFGLAKKEVSNGKAIYVPHSHIKLLNGILFFLYATIITFFHNGEIFIVYFPHCSLIRKFFPWKKMNVDVRTLSVSKSEQIRRKEDELLCKELKYFDSISVISQEIAKKCNLNSKSNIRILPLGADVLSRENKDFNSLKILYVGNLYNRNIIDTVKGVDLFVKRNKDVRLEYDIIGGGEELGEIRSFIKGNNLEKIVFTHGAIPYDNIKPFMDKCNIGVSYIPITKWFNYQPPTKTFDYILSGLFCVATETYANSQIIKKENGVLHKDTPLDFCRALEIVYERREELDSSVIRNTLISYQWKNIVDNYLRPILER